MYGKIIKILVIVVVACLGQTIALAQPVLRPSAKSLAEAVPEKVAHLIKYWPDSTVIGGPNDVSRDKSRDVRLARKMSAIWIRKILSPDWLPREQTPLGANLIMIRNEFGDFDVSHVQWATNGYVIKVSQTAGIFAVKLTPLDNNSVPETPEEKREFAKALGAQIFNNTGMRYGIRYSLNKEGKRIKKRLKVPVKDLAAKICDYSFRAELTREYPDGIVGLAARKEDEGITGNSPDRDVVEQENLEDNPNWHKLRYSWGYWWRHVCWWHDGKSIGFFTLKTEAGSWAADYSDNFGTGWFKGRAKEKEQEK